MKQCEGLELIKDKRPSATAKQKIKEGSENIGHHRRASGAVPGYESHLIFTGDEKNPSSMFNRGSDSAEQRELQVCSSGLLGSICLGGGHCFRSLRRFLSPQPECEQEPSPGQIDTKPLLAVRDQRQRPQPGTQTGPS